MEHLTIVCSSAVLYDTALRMVTYWNQEHYPPMTLSYMTPRELVEKHRAGEIRGDVVVLDGLPWKLWLFSPIQEYEYLDFGVRIGKAQDFEVIQANPDKLLNAKRCMAFYGCLDKWTTREIKQVYPITHSLMLCFLGAFVLRMTLQKIPYLPVLYLFLLAGLRLERAYIKQQQYLYGAILFIRNYLFALQ